MEHKIIPVVQHTDRAIKPRDYDQFGDKILVTSIFYTVQGEGPLGGYPAVFIRTAGCNFGNKGQPSCAFCDTNFYFDKGQQYTPAELLENAKSLSPDFPVLLVITGGEPTLQHNLIEFIKLAQPHFTGIQIETNGTQASFFAELTRTGLCPTVVVSPKASLSANRYAALSEVVLDSASCLKFILTADADDPHHTVPDWAFTTGVPVYVSPMAVYKRSYEGEVSSAWDSSLVDQEATAKNYAYAASYAMKHNCILSIQQHLFTAIP
jgi:7-carboxy-7-deazaguanine synthase